MPKEVRPSGKENRNPQEEGVAIQDLSFEELKDGVDSLNPSISVFSGPNTKSKAASKPVYDMKSSYDGFLFSSDFLFQDHDQIRGSHKHDMVRVSSRVHGYFLCFVIEQHGYRANSAQHKRAVA